MSPQPSEIEIVPLTPADFGIAFLLGVLLLLLAVGLTAWVVRGPADPGPEPVDDVERTVEIRTLEVKRGPRRAPHTGAIHAAHLPAPDDSPTQVIRRPGVRS